MRAFGLAPESRASRKFIGSSVALVPINALVSIKGVVSRLSATWKLARNGVRGNIDLTLKWRVRLSPVPLKSKREADHRLNLPLFAPRVFVKCPSTRRIDGRGGGDRKQYQLELQGLRRNAGQR